MHTFHWPKTPLFPISQKFSLIFTNPGHSTYAIFGNRDMSRAYFKCNRLGFRIRNYSQSPIYFEIHVFQRLDTRPRKSAPLLTSLCLVLCNCHPLTSIFHCHPYMSNDIRFLPSFLRSLSSLLFASLLLFCLVLSHPTMSCHVLSYLVLSCLAFVTLCHVVPCLVLSCLVSPYHVLACLIISCLIMSCLCHTLSCRSLSCLVLSSLLCQTLELQIEIMCEPLAIFFV